MNLRMDMDDLRRDFEHYQQRHVQGGEISLSRADGVMEGLQMEEVFPDSPVSEGSQIQPPWVPPPEAGSVIYRPGMTMEEVEEEAIRAVLSEVGGNRRKAAERLDIGERTLYRKIKKYGLDA